MPKSYTRTGDDGTTSRFGGTRMSKSDTLAAAIGTLDETNAALGLARSLLSEKGKELDGWLEGLQDMLFRVGADLSTPFDHPDPLAPRITREDTKMLEKKIDSLDDKLPKLKQFILPAGTPAAAALHLARATMRRAEREFVATKEAGEKINEALLSYVNRLSSYLFALARWLNWKAGLNEEHPRYK